MSLTIIIPVYEHPSVIAKFLIGNKKILAKYPIVIVVKGRSQELEELPNCTATVNNDATFWEARRIGLRDVKTKYVLNLDVDTILPDGYIERAIEWLEDCPKVGIVTINYQKPYNQNHGAFGTSIMRTGDMKKLYDYNPKNYPYCQCECKYMQDKILKSDMGTVTLDLLAVHIKEKF
jgi:cellulose synthase/poly-beta-1,6-N-acetylglucosamine synthase-like glycosyltransferase